MGTTTIHTYTDTTIQIKCSMIKQYTVWMKDVALKKYEIEHRKGVNQKNL